MLKFRLESGPGACLSGLGVGARGHGPPMGPCGGLSNQVPVSQPAGSIKGGWNQADTSSSWWWASSGMVICGADAQKNSCWMAMAPPGTSRRAPGSRPSCECAPAPEPKRASGTRGTGGTEVGSGSGSGIRLTLCRAEPSAMTSTEVRASAARGSGGPCRLGAILSSGTAGSSIRQRLAGRGPPEDGSHRGAAWKLGLRRRLPDIPVALLVVLLEDGRGRVSLSVCNWGGVGVERPW